MVAHKAALRVSVNGGGVLCTLRHSPCCPSLRLLPTSVIVALIEFGDLAADIG